MKTMAATIVAGQKGGVFNPYFNEPENALLIAS